jgi:hypothetical protein
VTLGGHRAARADAGKHALIGLTRSAMPVRFPDMTLQRTGERTNRAPAIDDLLVPERRMS